MSQTARVVERAFDEALGEAGGTLPVWLILLNLKIRKPANQRELAEAVGVREATLTHHLNAMDARGLVTRTRDAANRRVQVVALTEAGEVAFARQRDTAIAFDAKLRAGLADADLATLSTLLGHLAANAGGGKPPAWPTAARSNRSGSGPATRRPPPYRALTGRSTPPAASYPPVTCKIDAHPRLVHPPPEVSEVAGTVSSVNTLRQRCRCRWNLPKHAPERDSAAGRHAYKGAAPRPHCGSEFPGDDHRIHARLRQSLAACGHFWPDAISQQVCEGGRSPAVGM